jgi:hypothetical protein
MYLSHACALTSSADISFFPSLLPVLLCRSPSQDYLTLDLVKIWCQQGAHSWKLKCKSSNRVRALGELGWERSAPLILVVLLLAGRPTIAFASKTLLISDPTQKEKCGNTRRRHAAVPLVISLMRVTCLAQKRAAGLCVFVG